MAEQLHDVVIGQAATVGALAALLVGFIVNSIDSRDAAGGVGEVLYLVEEEGSV